MKIEENKKFDDVRIFFLSVQTLIVALNGFKKIAEKKDSELCVVSGNLSNILSTVLRNLIFDNDDCSELDCKDI